MPVPLFVREGWPKSVRDEGVKLRSLHTLGFPDQPVGHGIVAGWLGAATRDSLRWSEA